jgi:YfiH family protein
MLLSDVLARVPHAFTTRVGGHSPGIFASLNFGNPSELVGADRDPRERIEQNWGLVLRALGVAGREIVQTHQVHGDGVLVVRAGRPAHATPETTKADALVTDDPARVLAVRVADCCPVLMASADGRVVGAAHAGWRGVLAGVALRTIDAMRALLAERGEADVSIIGAIGPCISAAHFEVGPEVAERFALAFADARDVVVTAPEREGADAREGVAARPRVDLQRALMHQLRGAGVDRVDTLALCTLARPDLFFSHRRDHGRTGRMAAIIGPVA